MKESRIEISHARCDFCGTCVAVCPADAITLEESAISVDPETCTVCLNCVHICPLGVPEVVK
ncbi:4Fe-4S binding protein [candidate division KSB1 bacterium]|nr:4Fe-4S binding protein [candidate division KSB1 bacterium]